MSPSSHFHLFPALPTEIRLKIWSFALSVPRHVEIKWQKRSNLPCTPQQYYKAFTTTTSPPPLIHACHESRIEALDVYHPYFVTAGHPPMIYIAFDRDTVKFLNGDLGHFGKVEMEGIQRMSLEVMDLGYFIFYNLDIMKRMKCLRFLELVVENGGVYSWDRGDYGRTLEGELEEEGILDPEWRMPRIKIVDKYSKEETAMIEGREWL
jgi:hypothetical protein